MCQAIHECRQQAAAASERPAELVVVMPSPRQRLPEAPDGVTPPDADITDDEKASCCPSPRVLLIAVSKLGGFSSKVNVPCFAMLQCRVVSCHARLVSQGDLLVRSVGTASDLRCTEAADMVHFQIGCHKLELLVVEKSQSTCAFVPEALMCGCVLVGVRVYHYC